MSEKTTYLVKFKDDTPDDKIDQYIESVKKQGGEIKQRNKLFKGLTVSFPADKLTTLEANEHVETVEPDSIVRTQ